MELFEDIQSGCEADIYQPLLAYLRAKKNGQNTPPYIPKWDLLSIQKLCRMALLWQEAGFEQDAGELAHWLLPLEMFLPLWCPEKEYDEKEAQRLFSLLSKIKPIPGKTPDFDLLILENSSLSAAITLSGNGTSLGVIRSGSVEIRAIGPQGASLKFGIQGRGMNGWTRCFAANQLWLELKPQCLEKELKLDLRFLGVKPEVPLSFAFYVKAESCQIGAEIFKPKSLRRYHGEAQTVIFQNQLMIESALPHKVEVIPLAGEGCFWNCEFLVAFEIHPFAPQASFSIKTWSIPLSLRCPESSHRSSQ